LKQAAELAAADIVAGRDRRAWLHTRTRATATGSLPRASAVGDG
jgi:hypothetical protein